MKQETVRENKMGVMDVNKLLLSMAGPMMVSQLVQALYNVVDSVYVSRITTNEKIYDASGNLISAGTDAISALGLAFPFQILIIALAMGTAVGMNSLVSRSLGAGKQEKADKAAMQGVTLMALSFIISLCIGIFFARPAIALQGATGRKLEYGVTYLRIVSCLSIALYMEVVFERMLQATGRTKLSMIPQVTGAIINVIMDPILIYGFLGMPKFGVAGAAYATVFGQSVATFLGIMLNLKYNPDLNLKLKNLKPDLHVIKQIYVVGLPAILMQAVGSVMNFGMNKIILTLNENAVAVFTAYYKLQSFFFMPIFGLGNAQLPIIAYNFGAGKKKRLLDTFKYSLFYGFLLLFVGFLAFELIPGTLLKLFDTGDGTLITYGVPAIRIIGTHFLLAWFCIVTGNLFQALGNGVYSMVVSFARQIVVLIPAAYILGKIGGINLMWWCFPIAEGMSLLCTVIFFLRINKNIISKMPEEHMQSA